MFCCSFLQPKTRAPDNQSAGEKINQSISKLNNMSSFCINPSVKTAIIQDLTSIKDSIQPKILNVYLYHSTVKLLFIEGDKNLSYNNITINKFPKEYFVNYNLPINITTRVNNFICLKMPSEVSNEAIGIGKEITINDKVLTIKEAYQNIDRDMYTDMLSFVNYMNLIF